MFNRTTLGIYRAKPAKGAKNQIRVWEIYLGVLCVFARDIFFRLPNRKFI